MKSLTEFLNHKIAKGIAAKTALATEGKTPEEIEQNIGENFKLEGDKLKYFINCMEVAAENAEGLMRIRVVLFDEGESIPPKAVMREETYYIPEFKKEAPGAAKSLKDKDGKKQGGKRKRKDGPKSSPWGISPEEEAAKKAGSKKNAKKDEK